MPPRKAWLIFALILRDNYFLMRLLFPAPDAPVSAACCWSGRG